MTNEDRAERGGEAVAAWMATHDARPAYGRRHWPLKVAEGVWADSPATLVDVQTEAAGYIGDVLADLLHFAELCGVPAEGVIERARLHFDAESSGDES